MITRATLIGIVFIATGLIGRLPRAEGLVNLELRPTHAVWDVGDVVEIGLYAVSTSGAPESVRGMQVILEWEPGYLELASLSNNGPYNWVFSALFSDAGADGLNADCGADVFCQPYTGLPYNDGDAFYQAGANFTVPAQATPAGLLVTTFRFNALATTALAAVQVTPTAGMNTVTQVFGEEPGSDVTGTLGTTTLELVVPHWGTLDVEAPAADCGVWPGDVVIVELRAADLEDPINAVQTLLTYNDAVLQYLDVLPGDGVGSPWNSAAVVHKEGAGGQITYAVALLGTETQADAVVGRILFLATGQLSASVGMVSLVTDVPPLTTKFSSADTGITVIPSLQGPALIARVGDWNLDGSIDLEDHASVPACLRGPGVMTIDSDCCRFDFDRDGDIDLYDFSAFAAVLAE